MYRESKISAKSRSALGGQNPKSKISSILFQRTIGLIGAGTMGQALIKGFLAHGLLPRALRVADASAKRRQEVSRRLHCSVTDDNVSVMRESDVVILAIKPQQFPEVIPALARHLDAKRHLVISIAAGMTLRWLQARLPKTALVRVMPNLPATVGCGFSAIAAGKTATPSHLAIARTLFRMVGEVVELPERHFDAITAVSGSGPAYLFFIAQAWEQAAVSLGLPAAVAGSAIRQTLRGGLQLLEASGEPAAALIAKVASKGGTTEAALKMFARRHVAEHFGEALRAAAHRSKELSWS